MPPQQTEVSCESLDILALQTIATNFITILGKDSNEHTDLIVAQPHKAMGFIEDQLGNITTPPLKAIILAENGISSLSLTEEIFLRVYSLTKMLDYFPEYPELLDVIIRVMDVHRNGGLKFGTSKWNNLPWKTFGIREGMDKRITEEIDTLVASEEFFSDNGKALLNNLLTGETLFSILNH